MLRSLQDGIEVCVTVTLLDGHAGAVCVSLNELQISSDIRYGNDCARHEPLEAPEPYRTRGPRAVGRGAPQSSGITGNFGALPYSD